MTRTVKLSVSAPPFGLGDMGAAFDRATRIAKALFGAFEASIILIEGERVWRSRDHNTLSKKRAPLADLVLAEGGPLWLEDLDTDGRVAKKSEFGLRFFAGAPIKLSSGGVQGVLCVVGQTPRKINRKLLARLADIADGVADECDRMRAIRAEHESAAQALAASEVMDTLIKTLPMGMVMTDRNVRVLKASPGWAAFSGQSPESLVGKTLYEISPYFEQFRELHQRILAGAREEHPRFKVDRGGKTAWLHTQLMPWRDASGKVGGMVVTTHDVSDLVDALEKAEQSEKRLKMAMQIAELNIWELDFLKQELEYVGDYEGFFDERPEFSSFVTDPLYIVHPDDRPRAKERMARRYAGERFEPGDLFECRVNRGDDQEVWASIAVEPVRGEDGQVRKMLGVMQNITRRKQAELELQDALIQAQESEAQARNTEEVLGALVRTVPIAIVMTDRDLRIVRASPTWARHFGYRAEDVVGKVLYDVDPRLTKHNVAHQRCLAGEKIRDQKQRSQRPTGEVMWLQTALTPWRDKTGEVGGMLVAVHDITNMVEAMEMLERSERRLQMAIQLADLHVWEVDYPSRSIAKVGEDTFFEKPITFEDVEKDFFCSVHPDDRKLAEESIKKRMAGNIDERLVVRANRKDGKEVWMSSAAEVFLGEDGKPERVVGVFQNITAAKLAERALVDAKEAAEQANRSKSEFLANMSHEIRTPLNGVLGMTQVIESDDLSDVQRERIKVVRESGGALLAILNDLLDLSKIQAGKLELCPTDFDMTELAPVVAAAFEGTAASKDITLDLEIDESARGAWVGDVLRLRQVLSNLVSNALKFTAQGRVGLIVRHDGTEMQFAVEDSGIGIEADKIPQLFEKFAQEDASTTRRYGGTGLGLSICRELVDLMGGRIEVTSEKGVGSTFTVILPLKRGRKSAVAQQASKAAEAVPATDRPLRILAAEDNPTNQLVLRSLLAPLGVDLVIAGDGRAAVEAYRKGRFDVVLMDVQMPEMNGVEATHAIRDMEKSEGRSRTPILALSANVMTHQITEYAEAGMDGCIAKPIEVQKLYQALNEALTEPAAAAEGVTNAA